jgi:hypothetical protein
MKVRSQCIDVNSHDLVFGETFMKFTFTLPTMKFNFHNKLPRSDSGKGCATQRTLEERHPPHREVCILLYGYRMVRYV